MNPRDSALPPPPAARLVRRAYDRAAPGYDAAAVLQERVGDELLARIDDLKLKPARILDLGAGTGRTTRQLRSRFRRAHLVAADLSPAMLDIARARAGWFARPALVCADAHHLPFADGVYTLACSNLMLHWASDLDRVLGELARVMSAGAQLCFTTFGPDTLGELRAAYAACDEGVHVNRFLDMHDVGDALMRAGYSDPVLDVERYTLTYPTLPALVADLRATGATALPGRAAGLAGRARLAALSAAYEEFRVDGRLPATCEVIYARAQRSAAPAAVGDPREVAIPLNRIGRRR